MAWNIRAGGGAQARRIADQLDRWGPSIVVLCEFRGTPPSQSIARHLGEIGLIHQRSTIDAEHLPRNALLVASRWPLRQMTVPGAPLEPCRWLPVTVRAPQPIVLGAMHVPNKSSGRKYSFHDAVLTVASRWAQRPAVLLGDTNSGWPRLDEEVPCFGPREAKFLSALESSRWTDAFRCLHPRKGAYTWYSPNGRNGFRLDQGFLSPALMPRLRRVTHVWGNGPDAERLSDHAALVIDFVD